MIKNLRILYYFVIFVNTETKCNCLFLRYLINGRNFQPAIASCRSLQWNLGWSINQTTFNDVLKSLKIIWYYIIQLLSALITQESIVLIMINRYTRWTLLNPAFSHLSSAALTRANPIPRPLTDESTERRFSSATKSQIKLLLLFYKMLINRLSHLKNEW